VTTKKKVLIGAGALLGLLIVGGAIGGEAEEPVEAAAPTPTEAPAVTTVAPAPTTVAPTTTEPEATTTQAPATTTVAPAPESWTMPDLVGYNLQDAQDEIQSLTDFGILLVLSHDATGQDRFQLLDSGWIVCDQNMAAGEEITSTTEIDLGVVKDDEGCPGDAAGETETELTRSEENAIASAEDYLSFMAFSRSGLIAQLEFEGFTTAEATLAVDSIDVSWRDQAWKSAEDYLDFMPFSRSELIDQLIYEGFTPEQATWGVDKTGL
jgi:hypothetical protein